MIPIIIVGLYFLFTILIAIFATRKSKSNKDFDGNSLGILTCIAVGAGEWLGGSSTSGVAEYGYVYGISGAWYTIANGLGICFLAIFFAKKFRSLNKPTISGVIGESLGQKSRLVSSIIQLVIMIAVGISQMIAIGTIGEALFGLDSRISILLMGVVVLIYTAFGGMKAVGKTNMLHLAIMFIGMFVALITCLVNVGGLKTLTDSLPSEYFSMGTIGGTKISSWIIASLLGGCVAQAGLQPILAAKDPKTARKSSFAIALIVAPFGIVTALLGIISKYLFPDLANPKLALPTLLLSLNPIVGGLIMASILAAVLSTAGPIFLSCGTVFTRDIYSFNHERSDKQLLMSSRISTFVIGLVCIGLATLLFNMKAILDIVYFAYSLRGSLFIILFLGMYWKRISPLIANITMISTSFLALFWAIYNVVTGHYPIANWLTETYVTIFSTLFLSIVGSLIVSAIKKKQAKKSNEPSN